MPISLSPYNHYIFIVAIFVVVAFLVRLVMSLMGMVRAIAEKKPVLDDIQRYATLAQVKTQAYAEKKAEDDAKNKYVKLALPIVIAIYEIYKKNPEMVGPKGFIDASKQYVTNIQNDKKLAQRIKSML